MNEEESPIPQSVTLGSGRLARTIPVVEGEPIEVTLTGSTGDDVRKYNIGTLSDGRQVAWVAKDS